MSINTIIVCANYIIADIKTSSIGHLLDKVVTVSKLKIKNMISN